MLYVPCASQFLVVAIKMGVPRIMGILPESAFLEFSTLCGPMSEVLVKLSGYEILEDTISLATSS